MAKMALILQFIFGLHKTLYINFKCLPFKQAIHLPIWVSNKVKLKCGGGITVMKDRPGSIKLGFGNGSFENGMDRHSIFILHENSECEFEGSATIVNYFTINNSGYLSFGDGFSSNFGLFITCEKRIKFGSNNMLGWNNSFIDSDGHKMITVSGEKSKARDINIGNYNWITSECVFMKGSAIGNNSVVGYKSMLLCDFSHEDSTLIAGVPARIVKKIAGWEK